MGAVSKFVMPAEAGIQSGQVIRKIFLVRGLRNIKITLDSRSPPSRGQVSRE